MATERGCCERAGDGKHMAFHTFKKVPDLPSLSGQALDRPGLDFRPCFYVAKRALVIVQKGRAGSGSGPVLLCDRWGLVARDGPNMCFVCS